MAATWQEVPHAVAVRVEEFAEKPGLVRIAVLTEVERDSQTRIVIGRGGAQMEEAGAAARKELEELLGVKVYLTTRVTVAADWREDPRHVQELDWRHQLEQISERGKRMDSED